MCSLRISPSLHPISITNMSARSLCTFLHVLFSSIFSVTFPVGLSKCSFYMKHCKKGGYKAVWTEQDVQDDKDGKDGKESFESSTTELPSEAPTESKNDDLEAKEVEAAKHSKDHLQMKLFVVGM